MVPSFSLETAYNIENMHETHPHDDIWDTYRYDS